MKLQNLAPYALLISGLLATSCASHQSQPGAPTITVRSDDSYSLPAYDEKVLPNGLHILFLKDDTLPYITYSMMIKGGASADPVDSPGLTAFVGALLEEGTTKNSSTQIADRLARLAADFDDGTSEDYSLYTTSALSSDAEPLLDLYHEILTQPAFNETELERVRKNFLAQIKRRVDSPEAFADVALANQLYGSSHPYGHATLGTVASLTAIKRKNVIQQYIKFFRPNNAYLSVVGHMTPQLQEKVVSLFSSWAQRDIPATVFTPPAPPLGLQIRVIDKPDLVQAQIRLGEIGIRRADDDYIALRLANTILGGAFSSRLVNHVRRDLGLTYSISSSFDARLQPGPFEIETFTRNDMIGKTVQETLAVLKQFHDVGVTDDEVAQAKGYMEGIFPTSIETPEKLAFNLMVLRLYGVPDSYLKNYLRDLKHLSAKTVNEAIKHHIDANNMKVIVYGKAADAVPQLKGLGTVETKKASDYQ